MRISREDVLRVAQLANLELSSAEADTYQAQLDQILGYIDKLKELDVAKVEPMAQVVFAGTFAGTAAGKGAGSRDSHPELRDDVLRPCDVAEAVLAQAPEAAKPFFRVPRVIEK